MNIYIWTETSEAAIRENPAKNQEPTSRDSSGILRQEKEAWEDKAYKWTKSTKQKE